MTWLQTARKIDALTVERRVHAYRQTAVKKARWIFWKQRLARIPGARQAWGCGRRLGDWIDYAVDFSRFAALATASGRQRPRWADRQPCLGQKTSGVGFDAHYVYHTAWAARVLAHTRPTRHVDFSSSLYFVGIASAFVPLEHYDFRTPGLKLESLVTGISDLLHLPFPNGSLPSLSCMHVVEHIGLSRYGGPLDPEGDTKAMRELVRVLAPGGDLLIVTPVGRARVCFNAHRIYSFEQIRNGFAGLTLQEFALIPDDAHGAGPIYNASQEVANAQRYGCGCFWFQKPGERHHNP